MLDRRSRELLDRAVKRARMGNYLERHPLKGFELRDSFADLDGDDRTSVGLYRIGIAEILVNAHRAPGSYGDEITDAQSVTSCGRTAADAIERTAVHELGHHLRERIGGTMRELLADAFLAAHSEGRSLTSYAETDVEEYFAECFAGYVYHPAELCARDREGYSLIQMARTDAGLEA